MDLAALLGTRELVVVTGKGGVGKTALAGAVAVALHGAGRRVLVLEADPRESLHQLLGTAPSAGDVVPVRPGLWLQNLQPRRVVERLVHRRIPIAPIANAFTASPVFGHFVEGSPGLKEMALLGQAVELASGVEGPGVDTVVLDAPATGHGLQLLAAPRLVSAAIGGGPLGELAAQVDALVAAPARSAIVAVALAEELPVQETLELLTALRSRVGREPALVVANQLYPPVPPEADGLDGALGPALDLWRRRRAMNERELRRLRTAWPGAFAELPLLAEARGPALVDALATRLDTALREGR
ncbi:MAG TPA: ArsA-related P-loop ATPase [Gemmatimonadales bacterium]|nr:ArsA-related P-loop ATPase [Gemmatimonadales bacterium]